MIKHAILFVLLLLMVSTRTFSQNVSSPYSILGVGDIDNGEYGRYSASGSAAVSRREQDFYNFSNPASLTALPYKTINLNFELQGRVSQFKVPGVDTITSPSKDFVIKRAALAFKVTPTTGIAFGLKPFSTVNYKYSSTSPLNADNNILEKNTDGSGGLNQFYFSVGKALNKRLSAGATASWLFGSVQNTIEYTDLLLGLDITKSEYHFYNAAGLQLGLQYYSLPNKKWRHSFGITTAAFTTLKGQYTANYKEDTVTIKTLDPSAIAFKLPASVNAGYSIANSDGLSFHIQANYNRWPSQKLNYSNAYTKDAYGINVGAEYSKKVMHSGIAIEKYYVGLGVKMQQSYFTINNNYINDYAITFGGGKNLSQFLSVNGSIAAGRRGSIAEDQIKENYFQLSLGLTLKNLWFGTKKFGRFN